MRVGEYLASRAYVLALSVACCGIVILVLAVTGAGAELVILVCAAVLIFTAAALSVGFIRDHAFWTDLEEAVETLDAPRLAPEMLEDPRTPEARRTVEALRAVAKSANDEVAASRRQVEEYRAYVETWVHETKSPLAAASLFIENLEADSAAAACNPDRLEDVAAELHRVEGFIEQALYYARSESLDRDYLVRPHALRELVGDAICEDARELIAAGIAPRLGKGLDLTVYCDEKWLVFMVRQLLQNSIRYVRADAEGGPAIRFSARHLDEGSADDRIELTVADNGIGCPAADLDRVFDRGFTGDNGRAHRHSTGLGLWLVARLAVKMGLTVRAESEPGTSFTVTISFPTNRMHMV